MAKTVDLIMPKMGESIAEATILKWLKQEGEEVKADEPVLEIATDKVDSEVPSPVDGKVGKILFPEGEVVAVGAAIARIETEGAGNGQAEPAPAAPAPEPEPQQAPAQESRTAQAFTAHEEQKEVSSRGEGGRFYSPLVLNIARNEGVGMDELEQINGSGRNNRVTKKDILGYLKDREEAPAQPQQQAQQQQAPQAPAAAPQQPSGIQIKQPEVQLMEGDELVEMDRMRKLIADHMVMSKHVSPHVTSMVEADVTNLVKWREKNKKKFQEREGEKLTFTPIFFEAVVKAIRDFPGVNVSVKGNQIVKRKHINLGMAAAMPSGNLIVPVIKDADELNLRGLAKRVNDLANRARDNKLKPEEIQGGTYTVTNVGTFGNVMGTPVINQPQVAILALGAIRKKPAVVETEYGDLIAVRHMMFLSHSYDHRIVDGQLGGMFVKRVADYLEQWDPNREI